MSKNKKRKIVDPHAQREAANYSNPVASRELILSVLEASEGPLSHKALCEHFALNLDESIEALRRRLIAMVRDGQLIVNRKGAFGRIDKMDLVKGKVLAHKDGYGFMRPDDGGSDMYLTNRQMRKVFDGDDVLVRKSGTNFRGQTEAAIVEVLKRNTSQLVGQFVSDKSYCYLSADNPKVHHDIIIEAGASAGAKNGQIVVVELTQQPGRNQRPQGRVKEILGDHLSAGMEIDVAIRSHGVPHEWPQEVLQASSSFTFDVDEADKAQRVDLRELAFVTIDGEDARDFDDAVYCETKRSGGWRLYVAIADVSHYVRPNSALDTEAQNRGNSVYFPNYVVPMLPEVLSNGLCSLNPHVDRLCMVCEMTISAAGKVSGYKFYEAVMHSKARLTYTKVGHMIDPTSTEHTALRSEYAAVVGDIDELYALYNCLHAARKKRGAIEFETTETRMQFDQNKKIQQIVPVYRNDAHRLIEECMLAANVCAARFLEAHELPGLYRVHDQPKPEKLELLQKFLVELGLSLPTKGKIKPSDYQGVLAQTAGRVDAHLIQTVLLRSMNQAVYQPENLGHFGLAYSAYAHFTSPIRRYPDLLVHRALRHIVRSEKKSTRVRRVEGALPIEAARIYPYSAADMEHFGVQCSFTERRADDATRDVESWLKCEYLQDHVGETYQGVVSGVTGFGLFVELADLYVEGLIHITSLPQDYYHHEAAHHRLTGERTNVSFHLGDELVVRVVRVSLDERKIDFELADSSRTAGKSLRGSKRQTRKQSKVKSDTSKPSSDDLATEKAGTRKPRKRKVQPAGTDTPAHGEFKSPATDSKKPKTKSKAQPKKKAKAKAKPKTKPKSKRSADSTAAPAKKKVKSKHAQKKTRAKPKPKSKPKSAAKPSGSVK